MYTNMNFKAIKRAEELRLNIENQDKEIIEMEKVMYRLAIEDGHGLILNLSVTPNPGTGHNFKSGGYIDSESRERIERKAPSRSSFVITNGMALEFLDIYHKKLIGERALAFKLLEECIKTLKVLD